MGSKKEQPELPKVLRLDPVQTDADTGAKTISFNTDPKAMALYGNLIRNGIVKGNETRAMQLAASMLLAVFIFMAERFGAEQTATAIKGFVDKFVDMVNKSHQIPSEDKRAN